MTAACDLVRKDGAKRVLLLSGTVTEISPKSWTYGKSNFKTPIMKLPREKRVFVRWDAKDIATLTHDDIRRLLGAEGNMGCICVFARPTRSSCNSGCWLKWDGSVSSLTCRGPSPCRWRPILTDPTA